MEPLVYAVEPFARAWPDAQALLRLHWLEIALHQDVIELAPAQEQYEHIDQAGQLLIVTARTLDGHMVGYYAAFVRPHLHYRFSLSAFQDLFYLHPDHRKGATAINLFREAERALRARGVERVFGSCKVEPDLRPLFKRLGWTQHEYGFTKLLKA